MMPGPDGAHSWHPMAYNPKTGLVYIPAQEIAKSFTPVKDFKSSEIGWNLGVDVAGTPGAKKGYLLAWDPVAQKEVWRSEHVGPWNGGIVATAGNLVIQGDATGHLNAYRADTGEKLWSIDVQSPIMAAPVSYEVGGEQYIAVLSGFGSAFSLQAGKVAAQSGNIRNISRVLAFKIGGTATLPAAPPTQQLALNPPPATADAATVSAGEQLFGRYCSACHGENAVGGGVVPDLRASGFLGNDFFYEIVLNGAMKGAGMAPFKAVLEQKDAAAIRAYLVKRANEDKGSGPALEAASSDAAATQLLTKYNCQACHTLDKKLVGPDYKEVAAKYAGDAAAPGKLAQKIKNGGSGVWGQIPMPPNSVPDADLKALVEWILAQK